VFDGGSVSRARSTAEQTSGVMAKGALSTPFCHGHEGIWLAQARGSGAHGRGGKVEHGRKWWALQFSGDTASNAPSRRGQFAAHTHSV
jgi:hypothetical protein